MATAWPIGSPKVEDTIDGRFYTYRGTQEITDPADTLVFQPPSRACTLTHMLVLSTTEPFKPEVGYTDAFVVGSDEHRYTAPVQAAPYQTQDAVVLDAYDGDVVVRPKPQVTVPSGGSPLTVSYVVVLREGHHAVGVAAGDGGASGGALVAASDTVANPTTTGVLAHAMVWTGSVWARLKQATITPTATLTGYGMSVGVGIYRAAASALTEGQAMALWLTSRGALNINKDTTDYFEDSANLVAAVAPKPLAVSTYSPDRDASAASEASSVTKASAGNMHSIDAINLSGGALWLQIFDAASAPAEATVPKFSFPVAAGAAFSRSWGTDHPVYHATGIYWCWSSTAGTKTIAAASGLVNVGYK